MDHSFKINYHELKSLYKKRIIKNIDPAFILEAARYLKKNEFDEHKRKKIHKMIKNLKREVASFGDDDESAYFGLEHHGSTGILNMAQQY